jgi:hypothetical protein
MWCLSLFTHALSLQITLNIRVSAWPNCLHSYTTFSVSVFPNARPPPRIACTCSFFGCASRSSSPRPVCKDFLVALVGSGSARKEKEGGRICVDYQTGCSFCGCACRSSIPHPVCQAFLVALVASGNTRKEKEGGRICVDYHRWSECWVGDENLSQEIKTHSFILREVNNVYPVPVPGWMCGDNIQTTDQWKKTTRRTGWCLSQS